MNWNDEGNIGKCRTCERHVDEITKLRSRVAELEALARKVCNEEESCSMVGKPFLRLAVDELRALLTDNEVSDQ